MARITPFSVGQRWYVDRGVALSPYKPNFWFVILGPGDTSHEKLCLLEIDTSHFAHAPLQLAELQRRNRTVLSTYSHAHLKKHATLVTQTPEAFQASQARCNALMVTLQPLRNAEMAPGTPYALKVRAHAVMESLIRGEALKEEDQRWLDGLRTTTMDHAAETPVLQAAFDEGRTPSPSRAQP